MTPTTPPAARSVQQTAPGSGERQIGPQGAPGATAAGRPGQPGAANGTERRGATCEEIRKNAKFNILFEKVDIEKLVQTVADATCKTFILPDTLRGKISIIGPENGRGQVDADQFYAAFLAALDTNNLTVYPYGRFLKIVDKNKSKQSPIPTLVDPDDGYTTNEQMVTRFFKVRYVEVDRLKGVLQSLVSQPGGDLIAFEPDTIIITDEGSNMHRLERIIRQLDAPSASSELRVIKLNFAAAADVADKIQKLFEAKGAKPGSRPGAPGPGGITTPPAPGAPPVQPAPPGQPSTHVEGAGTGPATLTQMIPDERTNKLIIVASPAAFERIISLISAIDVPIAGEGRINVYFLQNTSAEDIAATLQSLAQGTQNRPRIPTPTQPIIPGQPSRPPGAPGVVTAAELFSGEVKISADKSSNALVIVASQADYRSLKKIIEELDLPRRQVFIETVIMEVNLDRSSEFGINFSSGYVLKTDSGNVPILFGTKLRQSTPWTSLTNLTQFSGFLAGLQGPNIPELEKLGLPVPQFGVVIHALQQSSDVNVLSTPHILASDNEEAEITVGQNVPFQAGFSPGNLGALAGGVPGTTTPGSTVPPVNPLLGLGSFFAPIQRQNVELKLTVKPHINKSDEIRMVINESTEEIASQDPVLGPTTSKRSAKTTVVAKDQETVVLGGIMQDRTIESVSKVPVLGDIPILGHLFRDQTRKKVKTNLLLFLTPYIIKDKSDFRRIFERKMKERQQFIELFYGQVPGYDMAIDFGRKAGPVARVAQLIRFEEQKIENGGPGLPGERVITPAPRRVPGVPADDSSLPPRGDLKQPASEPPPMPFPTPAAPRAGEMGEDLTGKSAPEVREPPTPLPGEPVFETKPTPDKP